MVLSPPLPAELDTAEWHVLRLCARPRLSAEQADALAGVVTAGLDWAMLLERAESHGLLPLLQLHLTRNCAQRLPPDVRARIGDLARAHAAHGLKLAAELSAVLQALSAEGVPAIPYKGPDLAVETYGSAALRTCADLDVFVPREMMEAAGAALQRLGYRTESPFVQRGNDLVYTAPECAPVELHWRLTQLRNAPKLDHASVWRRSMESRFARVACRRMHPADLALALAVHGTKHGWARLEWIASFAVILEQASEAGVDDLFRIAGEWRVQKRLLTSAELARQVLGTTLAPQLSSRIGDRHRRGAAAAARSLARGAPPFTHFALNTRLKDRRSEGLLYVLEMAFVPDRTDRTMAASRLAAPLLRMQRLIRKAFGGG